MAASQRGPVSGGSLDALVPVPVADNGVEVLPVRRGRHQAMVYRLGHFEILIDLLVGELHLQDLLVRVVSDRTERGRPDGVSLNPGPRSGTTCPSDEAEQKQGTDQEPSQRQSAGLCGGAADKRIVRGAAAVVAEVGFPVDRVHLPGFLS